MVTARAASRSLTDRFGRRVVFGGAGIALSLVVFVVLTVRWFLITPTEPPDRADAVVVLAGGRGERLSRALELFEEPIADTLVLSVGDEDWQGWPDVEPVCDAGRALPIDAEVVCFAPEPDSTKGEAAAIGALAAERGWEDLVLVTSSYHLHRAELRLSRCFDGRIHPVAAPSPTTASALLHEWLGTIEAQLLDRSC